MTPPLTNRDALEQAIAILRTGMCPPRHRAQRIVERLEAMALAMTLAEDPITERKRA